MDALQELPAARWPALQERLKALWPLNVGGYYALLANIEHPPLREAFQFKVFCPYGDVDNGFIATSVKSEEEYLIFPVNEDTNKLEEALANTKIIDWDSKVIIGMASSLLIRVMEKVKTKMDFRNFQVWGAKLMFLDKSSKQFEGIECPPGTYLAAVKQDDIKQVDDTWPFQYPGSHLYFSTLANNGLSYGLYSHDNNLLAWIFLNESNSLCHLYIESSHRRKGYGEFLMKNVANDCLKQGKDVYGYVVPGNQKAMELFLKLGFSMVDDAAWMNVSKKN